MSAIDPKTQSQIEADVLQRLLQHLQDHTEVQNIDLMILADFCRNCLAKWYRTAAEAHGVEMDYDQAREHVYGMPYEEWKARFQLPATAEQTEAFNKKHR